MINARISPQDKKEKKQKEIWPTFKDFFWTHIWFLLNQRSAYDFDKNTPFIPLIESSSFCWFDSFGSISQLFQISSACNCPNFGAPPTVNSWARGDCQQPTVKWQKTAFRRKPLEY